MKTSASISVQYDNPFSPFPGADWERAMRWVKEQGFDAAELILSDPKPLDADKIAATAAHLGLGIATIATGQAAVLDGLAMTSTDERVRDATFRRLAEDIDFSAAVGCKNVTIGLIRGKGGAAPYEIEYALLVSELSRIAEYAQKRGIVLNLEPINRYECRLINSTDNGRKLLKDIGNPENVGILYDTFHSNIEDASSFDAISRNADRISHVHFADSNRRLPGEGHFDFPRALKLLRDKGYNGYVSLEVLNAPSPEHIREFAGNRFMKQIKCI